MKLGETIEVDEGAGDLTEQLLATTNSPLDFVRLAYPHITPETWQRRVLQTIGETLQENARLDRWKAVQIAISSGNGVGKSAMLSWLILWAVTTFEDCLGVATCGTEGQLRTRLWSELSRWFNELPEDLRGQFQLEATALFNRQNPHTWRFDGRPWSERSQEGFSGLHNFKKRVLVVIDECSMVADSIWRACDGMLSDAQTQILWVVTGNPIRLTGRFPTCFPPARGSNLWTSFKVDSRSVSITNKESLNEKISYYGETSNYVKSHILGEFPSASTEQLIPLDWVQQASVRETFSHPADAVILGCDVASGHGEDSSCIVVRQGLDARTHGIRRYPTLNPLEFAYKIASLANELGADGIFIDAGGLGEGTVAKCQELGLAVHAVYFAGRPDNPSGLARAANKRSQMWLAMRDWLRSGAIPADATLMAELVAPEYAEGPAGILIERKQDMKSRGLMSPDSADALALTFGAPVWKVGSDLPGPGNHLVVSEWDPMSDAALTGRELPEARKARRYTAPGWSSLKPEWNHPDWTGDDWADAQASDELRWAGDDPGVG
jgi:hypothetical protein